MTFGRQVSVYRVLDDILPLSTAIEQSFLTSYCIATLYLLPLIMRRDIAIHAYSLLWRIEKPTRHGEGRNGFGVGDIRALLTHLAVHGKVSASTQNGDFKGSGLSLSPYAETTVSGSRRHRAHQTPETYPDGFYG